MRKYLAKNRLLIAAGAVLTMTAVPLAYQSRGCWAVGGEWLILPVLLMAAALGEIIIQDMMQLIHYEDRKGARRK